MKIAKKISNFLFFLTLTSNVFADLNTQFIEKTQFISPQKETKNSANDGSINLTLHFYNTLFAVIKSYKSTSQSCSAYFRPFPNEINDLNNANKLLNDLSECHKKKTGELISEKILLEFQDSNQDAQMINFAGNFNKNNNIIINPNSSQDRKICAENSSLMKTGIAFFVPFLKASGYPSKDWCERF